MKPDVPLAETSAARRIAADAARGLPEAEVRLCVAPSGAPPRVEAAYLAILGQDRCVKDSRAFDEDGVVVDFDAAGRILGFEILCRKAESALGAYSGWARSLASPHRAPALAAVPTVYRAWDIVDAVCRALEDRLRDPAEFGPVLERVLASVPGSGEWCAPRQGAA